MAEDDKLKPGGDGKTPDSNPIVPQGKRLQDLKEAIAEAVITFEKATSALSIQIFVWSLVCLAIISLTGALLFYFLKEQIPFHWTWQLVFHTLVRAAFVIAAFFIGSYCFRMLSATFQMYQHNTHKLSVLRSLPSLIVASHHQLREKDQVAVEQSAVYNKILDIIISFSNTGIISGEHEVKPGTETLNRLLSALEKYIIKKTP